MDLRAITDKDKSEYNRLATHVIQSWEWGEARKNLGLPILRYGIYENNKLRTAFQLTLHKIPFTSYFVGYLPKGPLPDKELAEALEKVKDSAFISEGKKLCFIKLEPDILEDQDKPFRVYPSFLPSPKPLFTKYNFVLDLNQSEGELRKKMHSKTRYNIKLAQKKGVKIEIRTDNQAFKKYLKLYFETTTRQGYHGHNEKYHQAVWETLKNSDMARIVTGSYKGKTLSCWMLLNFRDTLYYPYGGSSSEYREVMANNLVAWEAIKLGKKLGLKKFDMWGALGPNTDPKDPWYGFHRFKQGYGGKLVEYLGTYDLVFNDSLYWAFTSIDKLTSVKVFLLKLLVK